MEITSQSSHRLRIEFQTEPIGVLGAVSEVLSEDARIELDNALPAAADRRWLEFLTVTVPGDTSLDTALSGISSFDPVFIQRTSSVSNTFYILAFTQELKPRPITALLKYDAIPHRIVVKNQSMTVVATVASWQELKTLGEEIEQQHQSFELMGVTETTHMSFPLGGNRLKYSLQGKLTSEQLSIIETAYQCGYFEVPQQATADDVAKELSINQSTLSEQLRKAQNRLWNVLFGEREN